MRFSSIFLLSITLLATGAFSSPIIIDDKGTPPSRPGTPVGPPAYSTKKDVGVQTDPQVQQPPRLRDAFKAKAKAIGKAVKFTKKKRDFDFDLDDVFERDLNSDLDDLFERFILDEKKDGSRPPSPVTPGPPPYSTKKDVGVQTDPQVQQPPRLRDAFKAKAKAIGKAVTFTKKTKRDFDFDLDDLFERIIIDEKSGGSSPPPYTPPKKDVGVQTDPQVQQAPRLRDAFKAKAKAIGKFVHIGGKKKRDLDELYEYLLRRSLGFDFDFEEY